MDRRLFSLMPESRFARLSASPHDKSRRRTSGGFHPLPFRLTSGEANHPPQTGRRKTKCRAGADPTSITNDSIVLVRTTRRRDVFLPPFSLHSAGSFLPCHRPSAGRGKGLASSPAACGRPSRYRQPAKVIRIFHEKWKKEGWFVPVERQETLLHTG